MNYYLVLYGVILVSLFLIIFWIYSERNLNGKFNKQINYFSFPIAILGLYCVFRLNLDFGYILVSLTLGSLFFWVLGKILDLNKLVKESKSFFFILGFITIFRSFLYEPFQIPSESMIPGLEVGDFVLVNKFQYGFKNPIGNRTLIANKIPINGDVVVFTPPHTSCSSEFEDSYPKGSFKAFTDKHLTTWKNLNRDCSNLGLKYVKRVIASPGDSIEIKGKELFVNKQKILKEKVESNLTESFFLEKSNQKEYLIRNSNVRELEFFQTWIIPQGYYFVVGDNRDNSLDSRSWGLVPIENITGKAQLIWLHWPSYGSVPSFARNQIIK